jgi:hypothetical protein
LDLGLGSCRDNGLHTHFPVLRILPSIGHTKDFTLSKLLRLQVDKVRWPFDRIWIMDKSKGDDLTMIVGFSLQLPGYNGNPNFFMYFDFLQQVWDSSLPLRCKPSIMIESYCYNQSYKNSILIFYIITCLKF